MKRLSSFVKRGIAALAVTVGIVAFAAAPAEAAFDETNCYVPQYGSCRTYFLIEPHSTQHWIRIMGSNSGVYLRVYDATNGAQIWQGAGTGKWVTLYNVYAKYYVSGASFGGGSGYAYIDNCTSGCHQRS